MTLNILEKIDFWILDKIFQKIYKKIWQKWEITQYDMYINTWMTGIVCQFIHHVKEHYLYSSIFDLIFAFIGYLLYLFLKYRFQKNYYPWRERLQPYRILQWSFLITLIVIPPYVLLLDLSNIFIASSMYFCSLQSLPPVQRKKKTYLNPSLAPIGHKF
jgi:hypothetical protein